MAIAAVAPVKPAAWGMSTDAPEDKGWQAVAPGRVEPCSGQIKVATALVGLVDKVLVKANDRVFAGEPLIHLSDDELRARLAAAEAQVRGRAKHWPGSVCRTRQRRFRVNSAAGNSSASRSLAPLSEIHLSSLRTSQPPHWMARMARRS